MLDLGLENIFFETSLRLFKLFCTVEVGRSKVDANDFLSIRELVSQ